MKPIFITGCPRSGTTAVSTILDTASNASISCEGDPRMCVASRLHYEGVLPHPKQYLEAAIGPKVEEAASRGMGFGDKNQNYLFFIKELHEIFGCKFVFVVRDGRHAVTSMLTGDRLYGRAYHRYEDRVDSTLTEPEHDFWDFARLRPKEGEPLYDQWRTLPLFDKLCWYWSNTNEKLLGAASLLPEGSYEFLRIDRFEKQEYAALFDRLSLESYDEALVDQLQGSRINSRELPEGVERHPGYDEWGADMQARFMELAGSTMNKLGYETTAG